MASEKQMNFINTLYQSVTTLAPTLDAENATKVAKELKPYGQIIANVISEEDISFSDAHDVIGVLKSIVDKYSQEIKWRKHNSDWVIVGANLVPGETVTVTSKKGKQQVVVGDIVYTEGNKVYAKPAKADVDKGEAVDQPGFYHKDDQIIEAYYTKSGFLVARTIVNNKKGEYLGKAGLIGLGEKLTLEEIKLFGRETGVCMVCSRELSDPESLALGLGPVCLARGGF